MPKFRKKPVVIEAIKIKQDNLDELISFAGNDISPPLHGACYVGCNSRGSLLWIEKVYGPFGTEAEAKTYANKAYHDLTRPVSWFYHHYEMQKPTS